MPGSMPTSRGFRSFRMAARRATASGGGTKPGAESEKTSRLVSKSRCIGVGGGGDGGEARAAAAAVAAADFLFRRRVFLEDARPSRSGALSLRRSAAATLPAAGPTCATGIIFAELARAGGGEIQRRCRSDLGPSGGAEGVTEGGGDGGGYNKMGREQAAESEGASPLCSPSSCRCSLQLLRRIRLLFFLSVGQVKCFAMFLIDQSHVS